MSAVNHQFRLAVRLAETFASASRTLSGWVRVSSRSATPNRSRERGRSPGKPPLSDDDQWPLCANTGHSSSPWRTRQIDPVWTALRWQGFFGRLCNTGWCGHVSDLFSRHIAPLAIMPSAYQVPTISSHSRCWVEMGSPDPAVSTGLLHQLPFALPKLVSATAAALCF
jgi:hypothetical protein